MPTVTNTDNYYYGKSLRKVRNDSQYSQEDMASMLGLTRTSYCNMESGRQTISIKHLKVLCSILGCHYEAVIGCPPKVKVKEVVKEVKRKVTYKL